MGLLAMVAVVIMADYISIPLALVYGRLHSA